MMRIKGIKKSKHKKKQTQSEKNQRKTINRLNGELDQFSRKTIKELNASRSLSKEAIGVLELLKGKKSL